MYVNGRKKSRTDPKIRLKCDFKPNYTDPFLVNLIKRENQINPLKLLNNDSNYEAKDTDTNNQNSCSKARS